MKTRLVAYDRLGARRGVLPNPLEVVPVIPINDLPTLTVTYDRRSPKNEYIHKDAELAFERFQGNAWVEIPNARFRYLSEDFDHLSELPTRVYTFIGVGEALSGVTVYSAYGRPIAEFGQIQFHNVTIGTILGEMWNNAVGRGWKGFTKNFTGTHDSAGKPWPNTVKIAFETTSSLSHVLHRLVANGMVDYEWVGRQLRLYAPDGYLARDLTVGADPLRLSSGGISTGIDSAPENTDSSSLATHVVVLGENGLRWVFPTGWIAPEGRREIVLTYSGVDDEGTARLLADPHIIKANNILKNTTRQFHLLPTTKILPFRDYRPGDWVNVQRGTTFERMRVRVVSMQINDNGIQGFLMLGDKIDDILETMYERIQRLTGGVNNEGTNPVQPPKGKTPIPPKDFQVTATAYVDNRGATQGLVFLGFEHDQEDADNNPVPIEYYQVWYRPLGEVAWRQLMQIPGLDRSATYSPLPVYNEVGAVITYDFRVAAMSTEGIWSGSAQASYITMEIDEIAPFQPTTPIVTAYLMTIKVMWDGLGYSPSGVTTNMPPDFSHVEVHGGTSPDFLQMSRLGNINEVGFYTAVGLVNETRYYRFVAVDVSGNKSNPSAAQSITPQRLVDADRIIAKIDATKVALTNVDASVSIMSDTIMTRHLFVTEDMTVALLEAHKIEAHEIDVNSLTADAGFIGSLRTGILVSNSVKAAMIEGDALNGKIITGAQIQTNVNTHLVGGVRVDAAGIRAWSNNGTQTFHLNRYGGEIDARGRFVAKGNTAAQVELTPAAYGNSPGVRFNHGGSAQLMPVIYAIEVADTNYPSRALVLHGSESTINSSGRADLVLKHGGDVKLGATWGSHSGTGIETYYENLRLYGRIEKAVSARTMITSGGGPWQYINVGGVYEWHVVYGIPAYNGRRRPIGSAISASQWGNASAAMKDTNADSFKISLFAHRADSFLFSYVSFWEEM